MEEPEIPRQQREGNMAKHYLSYWRPATADQNLELEDKALDHCASDQYEKLQPGDTLWLVTARDGRLHLLGRFTYSSYTEAEGFLTRAHSLKCHPRDGLHVW